MEKITVSVEVFLPVGLVWEFFTNPVHIKEWSFASPDWHSPWAKNDLRVGGTFATRMEAVDGSQGFDFEGTYTAVTPEENFAYELADGRTISVEFVEINGGTKVTEIFDPETENPIEMQRHGWQSILDNFKQYAEMTIRDNRTSDTGTYMMAGGGEKKSSDDSRDIDENSSDAGSDGGGGGD